MKNVLIATTTTILLSGAFAQANYACKSFPEGSTLTVTQFASRMDYDTRIVLEDGPSKAYFFGKLDTEGGPLLNKEVIHLFPLDKGQTLTVISKPQSCGRGSCDLGNNKIIKAVLKLETSESNFYCEETLN